MGMLSPAALITTPFNFELSLDPKAPGDRLYRYCIAEALRL